MKEDTKIEDKFGRDTGFCVPENFFESTYKEIAEKIDSMPVAEPVRQPSRWERLRPFVYLAAMFAGIWCMMKVVTMVNTSPDITLDSMPEQLAQAVSNDDFYSDLRMADNLSNSVTDDYDLESDMSDQYHTFAEFEHAFNNL